MAMDRDLYEEPVPIPRGGVRFPMELHPPAGFDPDDLRTWPRVEGRLEWVGGRLLYMPPCGEVQSMVVGPVAEVLGEWTTRHPEFVYGTNEAGMKLSGDIRGADAAVWLRAALGPLTAGVSRVPPILAVEVAGRDEGEAELRAKAEWYFAQGVRVVWLVLPKAFEVVVLRADGETRHGRDDRLPPQPELPGLEPAVARFFRQIEGG